MLAVMACMLPGVLVETTLFGGQVAANILFAMVVASVTEFVCLQLMRARRLEGMSDASSMVTAIILAAALPPAVPWVVLGIAVTAAVALGKYAYGGLGNNVFNPAMVGYAIVLLSFPGALASWPGPVDTLTGATALTEFKYRGGATVGEIWQLQNGFGYLGAAGWEWVNLAFLAGGLVLLRLGLGAWRVCAALLGTLLLLSLAGYDGGSSHSQGSPFYHWFSGGTMLAVFFVATDPVTHPATKRGQWLFGLIVGALIYLIRSYGSYPDGIVFAVLLANSVTPLLDRTLARLRVSHG